MGRFTKKKLDAETNVVPNLIAMVDIMFLLLLFFMLGSDMSQREAADLVLPEADQVKEDNVRNQEEPLTTINVHHKYEEGGFSCPTNANGGICREDETHWLYAIGGREFDVETVQPELLDAANEALEPDIDPEAQRQMSRRKVLIRADMAAPFGLVNRLMEFCGKVGIYKIEVAAAQPAPE